MPRRWQEISNDDLSGGVTDYVDNASSNQSADITTLLSHEIKDYLLEMARHCGIQILCPII